MPLENSYTKLYFKLMFILILLGNLKQPYHRHNSKLHQRSFSVQQEGSAATTTATTSSRGHSISEVTTEDTTPTTTAAIDINVIQATPNISPSCSLRSFIVDSTTGPSAEAILAAIANEPSFQLSNSAPPTGSTSKGKVQRRVSFSEEEVEKMPPPPPPLVATFEWQKPIKVTKGPLRQNTLPSTMTYLQVPGQQAVTLMAPALTVEALVAQTSVQARKRRSTRLMKAGSFCSITSEGDGDIFAGPGADETVEVTINEEGEEEIVVKSSRKTIDPLLSDYSDMYDNDKSDISDLFERPRAPSRLRGQRTLSEEYGSIRSLSIDHDDQPKAVVKSRSVEEEDEMYASSSCSISIESDCEPGRGHQITVPVTIEPPPPEMRTACANNNSRERRDHHHHTKKSHDEVNKICQIHQSPKPGKHYAQDSTEEIKRASPGGATATQEVQRTLPKVQRALPEVQRALPEVQRSLPEVQRNPPGKEVARVEPEAMSSAVLEPGMRMVLVRDIGVQVSGDSPNLNLIRRSHKRHHSTLQQQQHQPPQKQDSLAEKFPAEILF
jgi:hypothetical protein